jgi:hypothetical protein
MIRSTAYRTIFGHDARLVTAMMLPIWFLSLAERMLSGWYQLELVNFNFLKTWLGNQAGIKSFSNY